TRSRASGIDGIATSASLAGRDVPLVSSEVLASKIGLHQLRSRLHVQAGIQELTGDGSPHADDDSVADYRPCGDLHVRRDEAVIAYLDRLESLVAAFPRNSMSDERRSYAGNDCVCSNSH